MKNSSKEYVDLIAERWRSAGRADLSLEIQKAPARASSGTEALSMIGGFLLNVRDADNEAFLEIEDVFIEYVEYCRQYRVVFD